MKVTKYFSALVLVMTLTFTSVPRANAGIILSPAYGVGIIFIVMGLVYDNLGLLILDGSNAQGEIQKALSEKYSFIDDKQVLSDLATEISNQIKSEGVITKEVEIKLDEAKIIEILAPTGLMDLEPTKVQELIHDLT